MAIVWSHVFCALATVVAWEAARVAYRLRTTPPVEPAPAPHGLSDLEREVAMAWRHTPDVDPDWTPPASPGGLTHGCEAFQYAVKRRRHDVRHLPAAVRTWLVALTEEQLDVLARMMPPMRIDLHIAGRRMLRGLPAVRPDRPAQVQTLSQIQAEAIRANRRAVDDR